MHTRREWMCMPAPRSAGLLMKPGGSSPRVSQSEWGGGAAAKQAALSADPSSLFFGEPSLYVLRPLRGRERGVKISGMPGGG
eukprot:6213196-Pleurochrysis_carterae.AAC.2